MLQEIQASEGLSFSELGVTLKLVLRFAVPRESGGRVGKGSALILEHRSLLLCPLWVEIKSDWWQTVFEQHSSSWLLIKEIYERSLLTQLGLQMAQNDNGK